MARTRQGPESGAERALGKLQLVCDAAILIGSIVLALALQPLLRQFIPSLRSVAAFREHATLVYTLLPLWMILIVTFRVHLAVPQRIGKAELLTRLIKLHIAALASIALIQFLTRAIINRSLVGLF